MEPSERQLLRARLWSACAVVHVENGYGGDFVVSCCLSSALLERCRWRCRSILVHFGTARVRQVIKLIHLQPVRGISDGSATWPRPQSRTARLTLIARFTCTACATLGTRL